MEDIDKLKDLAEQLSLPRGEKGLEIGEIMSEQNASMIYHSINLVDLHSQDTVLEIGHGNAKHVEYLFSKQENIHYTGLEIAGLMHQEALKNNQVYIQEDKATFLLYDGNSLPFETNRFSKIFTVNTIYFWKNPAIFMDELHRVLQVEGKLCITFGLKKFMSILPFTQFHFTLYDIEDVQHLAEQSDFILEDVQTTSEWVQSKMGTPIERHFATMVLKKK